MTELSQTILSNYQVRKSVSQKLAFIDLLRKHFPDLQVQEGGFPKSRNVIVGNVQTARVVLTAHYDTCARLPFPNFITPKNPLLVILYSLLMIVPLFLGVFLINLLLNLITADYWLHYSLSLIVYFGLLILMIAGPANQHTANDNTSGVILLCELLQQLSPEDLARVAFVFFDNEENGLLGSAYFRKCFKNEMRDNLLINFDCISDGDNLLFAVSKEARKSYNTALKSSYCSAGEKIFLFEKLEKVYYPSDQAGFKQSAAVASLNYKRGIGYYMDKIHTKKDTVFDERNITLLCEGTLRFLKQL